MIENGASEQKRAEIITRKNNNGRKKGKSVKTFIKFPFILYLHNVLIEDYSCLPSNSSLLLSHSLHLSLSRTFSIEWRISVGWFCAFACRAERKQILSSCILLLFSHQQSKQKSFAFITFLNRLFVVHAGFFLSFISRNFVWWAHKSIIAYPEFLFSFPMLHILSFGAVACVANLLALVHFNKVWRHSEKCIGGDATTNR